VNILFFGPNGSGKGMQCDLIKDNYSLEHIESGDIFRGHIQTGTELGIKARTFMDKGELVPDALTIPMVLSTLWEVKASGWLLDGFPRNVAQAKSLLESLTGIGNKIDFIVELTLDRQAAKNRIMGRRICKMSPHHPNNIFIDAIAPNKDKCRMCGSPLVTREDDQDEEAINKRHEIYYDTNTGTLAAVSFFTKNSPATHILIDANNAIDDIKNELLSRI